MSELREWIEYVFKTLYDVPRLVAWAGIAGMAMKELCDGFVQAAARRGAPQRNLALALPR